MLVRIFLTHYKRPRAHAACSPYGLELSSGIHRVAAPRPCGPVTARTASPRSQRAHRRLRRRSQRRVAHVLPVHVHVGLAPCATSSHSAEQHRQRWSHAQQRYRAGSVASRYFGPSRNRRRLISASGSSHGRHGAIVWVGTVSAAPQPYLQAQCSRRFHRAPRERH